jgi:hypothetical protein
MHGVQPHLPGDICLGRSVMFRSWAGIVGIGRWVVVSVADSVLPVAQYVL